MKLTMGIYEVEIKAKSVFNDRFNKQDTESLLTTLMVALGDSAVFNKMEGFPLTSKQHKEMMQNILETLNQ